VQLDAVKAADDGWDDEVFRRPIIGDFPRDQGGDAGGDHGGVIECDSVPRRTVFRILLPKAIAEENINA